MNHKMHLPFLMVIFGASGTFAAEPMQALPTCGSAKVVSGNTCSNVKVEIDFTGCDLKSTPQLASKVLCVGKTITGRLQKSDYRFEADFDKVDSGGSVTWKPKGAVSVFARSGVGAKAEQSAAVKSPEKETAVANVPPLPSHDEVHEKADEAKEEKQGPRKEASERTEGGEHGASPMKVTGFVDLRYSSFSAKDDPAVPNAHAESGFGFEEGAIHAEYEKGRVSFVANLAARKQLDVDATPIGAAVPNQASNNNFVFGVDHSELYLKYKLSEETAVSFGQFDAIYGVEANDSKDRVFGKTGLVYDQVTPHTHTGAMLESEAHHFTFKLFAANPSNRGSYGTSTNGGENTEYGTAFGYTSEHWHGQLGSMARPISKADGSALATRSLIDVTLGTKLGAFAVDADFSQVADPSKNTLTPTDNTDSEKPGSAVLVLATYELSKPWLLGLRYEHLQNDPGQLSLKNAQSEGASVHYKVSPDLETRLEYINYNFQDISEQTWNDSRLIFSALVFF